MTIITYLVDENGNRVIDENGNYIILTITTTDEIAGLGGFAALTGLLITDHI